MSITPLILGSGRAGQAIAKSLACLRLTRPELNLASPVWLKRDVSLSTTREVYANPVLCIANPHALHASVIQAAERAGFSAILCEKPAAVNVSQLNDLRNVKTPTAILHVYRQSWGIQTLKQMIDEDQFGEIIAIEGRYWQASTAERALQDKPEYSWKNDPSLAGDCDTYFDVGSHWVDAASFLVGDIPTRIIGWRSYVNSPSPHRDSHVQLTIDYFKARAFASISKTLHGATNHFEVNVIGAKKSATWIFISPDEILIGEGRERRVLTRRESLIGSRQPPFHGLGWLEGYIEISSRLLSEVFAGQSSDYPTLSKNLDLLEAMLKAEWH